MKIRIIKAPNKSNKYSLGGDFSNGVVQINAGGLHSTNPLEGVPMGVDNQGIPNLVEEGEVIFNDYVFSNRLRVPKAIRQKYKLRGITFADIAKQVQKESEERPNDPIAKDTMNVIMSELMQEQEMVRAKRSRNRYSHGGKLGNLFDGEGDKPNYLKWSWGDDFKYLNDGKYDNNYLKFVNEILTQDMIDNALKSNPELFSRFRAKNPNYSPTLDEVRKWATDFKPSDYHKFAELLYDTSNNKLSYNPLEPENSSNNIGEAGVSMLDRVDAEREFGDLITDLTDEEKAAILTGGTTPETGGTADVKEGSSVKPMKNNWLRYAPIIGSGIAVFNDLFGGNEPDYSNANMYRRAIDAANREIKSRPIGNYLRYTPFDRNYYINQLNANIAAGRRAVTNTSGGNRAAALAGLLATDYNYGNQLGQLARQAEEYNLAQRQQVEDFNRATNMYNSEVGMKADMANAEQAMQRARLYGTLASMRQGILNANRAEKSANLTNFIQGLGDLGRELTDKDMLRWLTEKGVLKSAYGGKIKRKKRGGFTI